MIDAYIVTRMTTVNITYKIMVEVAAGAGGGPSSHKDQPPVGDVHLQHLDVAGEAIHRE
jgi:hypothetical protein